VIERETPITINMDYCKGCGICAEECPTDAIQMVAENSIDGASADDTPADDTSTMKADIHVHDC